MLSGDNTVSNCDDKLLLIDSYESTGVNHSHNQLGESKQSSTEQLNRTENIAKWLEEQLSNYGCPMASSSEEVHMIDKCFHTALPPLDEFDYNYCKIINSRKGIDKSNSNTALSSISDENVLHNICTLRTEYILRLGRPLLQKLMSHQQNCNVFNHPVDPIALGLPTYFDKIKSPMDLGTVRSRLRSRCYKNMNSFINDVELVFTNAMLFNTKKSQVYRMAKTLLEEFKQDLKILEEKCIKDVEKRNQHSCSLCCGSLCYLCGEKCLKFEPPVLQCQGSNCGQRIKKNAVFYVTSDSSMLWCQKCYSSLPQQIPSSWATININNHNNNSNDINISSNTSIIDHKNELCDSTSVITSNSIPNAVVLQHSESFMSECFTECDQLNNNNDYGISSGEKVILKQDLLKRRADEEIAEPWVECDGCSNWYHQVCALYVPLNEACSGDEASDNKREVNEFYCPFCILLLRNNVTSSDCVTTLKHNRLLMEDMIDNSCSSDKSIPSSSTDENEIVTNIKDIHLVTNDDTTIDVNSSGGSTPIQEHLHFISDDKIKLYSNDSDNTSVHSDESNHKVNFNPIVQQRNYFYNQSVDKECLLEIDTISVEQHSDNNNSCDKSRKGKYLITPSAASIAAGFEEFCKKTHRVLPLSPDHTVTLDSADDCCDNQYGKILRLSVPSNTTGKSSVMTPSMHSPLDTMCIENNKGEQSKYSAQSLPRSKASDFIEALLKDLLNQNGYSEVAATITLRMVSNRDHRMDIPTAVTKNLCRSDGDKLPEAIGYRQKCFLLFQCIDGVDVCLFSLYVQEFNALCPAPNTSTAYIAYLDSVDYFRPMAARSMVYQEIVAGYLKWCQVRGFKQVHIWSCPPQRGDNFIFFSHPSYQRTPSRDRLNGWYRTILQRCTEVGIVSSTTNVWQKYFLPYIRRDNEDQVGRKSGGSKRTAAVKSFVGSGGAVLKKNKPRKQDTNNAEIEPERDSGSAAFSSVPESHEQIYRDDLPVPISPPIFEGDYWLIEYLRLHAELLRKQKAAAYGNISSSTVNQVLMSHLRRCRDIVSNLMHKDCAGVFSAPVDPIALNIPTYNEIITNPMDLGTVRDNLRAGKYPTVLEFANDVRLTFNNAIKFNPPEHGVHELACSLLRVFQSSIKSFISAVTLSNPELFLLDKHRNDESNTEDSVDSVLARLKLPDGPTGKRKQTLERVASIDSVSCVSYSGCIDYTGNATSSCGSFTISSDSTRFIDGSFEIPESTKRQKIETDQGVTSNITSPAAVAEVEKNMNYLDYIAAQLDINADNINQKYGFDVGKFTTSELSQTESAVLFSDVGKGVQRIQEDLMVITLSPYKGDDDSMAANCNTFQAAINVNESKADKNLKVPKKSKGRNPTNPISAATAIRKANLVNNPGGLRSIPVVQSDLLRDCAANSPTFDPDPIIYNPLTDSRHTFLEMCQFRHYQFDTLRRAKYSSMMILFYLHNPLAKSCRPQCSLCKNPIHHLRWHCDQCPDFDMCDECKKTHDVSTRKPSSSICNQELSIMNDHTVVSCSDSCKITEYWEQMDVDDARTCVPHPHHLTPYRVTFV